MGTYRYHHGKDCVGGERGIERIDRVLMMIEMGRKEVLARLSETAALSETFGKILR